MTFLNCQSFIGKKKLENDYNLKSCQAVGFADTRFTEATEPQSFSDFHNFKSKESDHSYHRFYSNEERPSLSLAVFNKIKPYDVENLRFRYNLQHLASCIRMTYRNLFQIKGVSQNVTVFYCYILPNSPNEIYISLAKEIETSFFQNDSKLIVLGDFNKEPKMIDNIFGNTLRKLGINQLIESVTHDQGHILDHVYTNIDKDFVKCGILDSITNTDHRPIFVSIRKNN